MIKRLKHSLKLARVSPVFRKGIVMCPTLTASQNPPKSSGEKPSEAGLTVLERSTGNAHNRLASCHWPDHSKAANTLSP